MCVCVCNLNLAGILKLYIFPHVDEWRERGVFRVPSAKQEVAKNYFAHTFIY